MSIERGVLKSVSEFSIFKYMLFFYLLVFLLSIIVISIIGLVAWIGISSTGISLENILETLGLVNLPIFSFLNTGISKAIIIVVLIVGGLVYSVFFAVMGMIITWIMNVVLKMSGGIELRFLPEVKKEVSTETIVEEPEGTSEGLSEGMPE
jgi:hypothetical protein